MRDGSKALKDGVSQPALALAEEKTGRLVVAALALAQLVSWGSIYYGFSLFVLPMEAQMGWSRTATNGALSLGLLVSGLFAYPAGRWIDRHGGRWLMAGGSLLASLLFFAWAKVASLPALYAIWIGFGLSMAATFYDPVFAVITRSYPHSFRTKIIGLTLVGGFASTVFIPLTQAWVDHLGWRQALVALGLLNLAICVPVHALLLKDGTASGPPGVPRDDAAERAGVSRALRHPVFWALLACFTVYHAGFAAMTFHLVPLMAERGMPTALIMAAMAIIGPAQVAARIVLLWLGRRVGAVSTGRLTMSAYALSILMLMLFPGSRTMLFAAMLLYGGANGMVTIVRGTAVPDLLWKEGYGGINGLISFPSNIAKAIGPIGAAWLWSWWGSYQGVLYAAFALAMVTVACFWVASERS